MDRAAIEEQWIGLCRNQGVWEGNLATYDADGVLQKRQPTVLFVHPARPDDVTRVSRGQQPYLLNLRLHRVTDVTDVAIRFRQGEDLLGRGSAFDPATGNISFANTTLSPMGSSVFEFAINYVGSDGSIRGRTRLVTVFSAEHLQRLAVFRERPGKHPVDAAKPIVPDDVRNSDTVSTTTQVNAETLCGTWRVETMVIDMSGGRGSSRRTEGVERRALAGGVMTIEGDRLRGVGNVNADGRSMVVQADGCADTRVVFLGGGVTATNSVAMPKGGEDFYVELAWLVQPGLRFVVGRQYIGMTWVGCCFTVERRE